MSFFKEHSLCLIECGKGRNNNLDLMRFIAAIGVLISHAFPLCLGENHMDYIYDFSGGQIHLGGIAVGVFFVFGGYLIAKSMDRLHDSIPFWKARVIRIFPPLIFLVLLTTFIIGPILTEYSLKDYFGSTGTYGYLLNGILIPKYSLPGVFTNNVYPSVINGSLWTLPVEFGCYIMCFVVYKLGFLNPKRCKYTLPLFVVAVIAFYVLFRDNLFLQEVMRPVFLFYIGMVYYVYKDHIYLNKWLALACAVVMVPLSYFHVTDIGMICLFPYIMFTIGYGTVHKFSNFTKYGEFSYGIYLWAFFIQQIVCQYILDCSVIMNIIISIPCSIIMGIITHYVIERPCLRKKK